MGTEIIMPTDFIANCFVTCDLFSSFNWIRMQLLNIVLVIYAVCAMLHFVISIIRYCERVSVGSSAYITGPG